MIQKFQFFILKRVKKKEPWIQSVLHKNYIKDFLNYPRLDELKAWCAYGSILNESSIWFHF